MHLNFTMIFGKKRLFLFFKNNFTRINDCKFIHHESHVKPFLSYLPCIVCKEYFSIIFNVKKCELYSIKYSTYSNLLYLYLKVGYLTSLLRLAPGWWAEFRPAPPRPAWPRLFYLSQLTNWFAWNDFLQKSVSWFFNFGRDENRQTLLPPGNSYWGGRISTVDLLITCSDQLHLNSKTTLFFLHKKPS